MIEPVDDRWFLTPNDDDRTDEEKESYEDSQDKEMDERALERHLGREK